MNGPQVEITITKVLKKREVAREGKDPIYEFTCSGTVKGKQDDCFTCKAFKADSAAQIVDGFTGTFMENEYKGDISYLAPFPKKAGGFQGGGKAWQPRNPVYTLGEFDALFDHAAARTTLVLASVVKDKKTDIADIYSRILSTYIISACNGGVKVGGNAAVAPALAAAEPAAAPAIPADNPDIAIKTALEGAGLLDEVRQAAYTKAFLRRLWEQADHVAEAFCDAVRMELLPADETTGDANEAMPF